MRARVLALLATIAALACSKHAPPGVTPPPPGSDARDPDALASGDAMPDGTPDATGDAAPAGPVVVACYSQAQPTTTCTAPQHCCFSNFSAQHDGACSTAACAWGTISCDGPEDCASGAHCCAHAITDPVNGTTGYTIACQTAACGASPDQELCHSSGTCTTGTCVGALGIDNDLPRALSICH